MYPTLTLFGREIELYNAMFISGLISVPIIYLCLRRRFGYSLRRALFYSLFTLGFGYFSAMLTAWVENGMLAWASAGAYDHYESLRNYGIPIFLPVFWLLFCAVFREPFKKLTDYLAPSVYSVMTFVKIGCTLGGCCYGEPDEHGIWNEELGYRTFPVQIYDALCSLGIVIVCLVLLYTVAKKRTGLVYPVGGMLFALTKGFWESFRVHSTVWEKNFLDTGWTFWQFWLLILFAACLLWLILTLVRDKKRKPDFDALPPGSLPHPDLHAIRVAVVASVTKEKKKSAPQHGKKKKKK